MKTSGRLRVQEVADGYNVRPWYNLRGKWLAEVSGLMPGDRCKVTAEKGKITIAILEASEVYADEADAKARQIVRLEKELATMKGKV